MPGDIFQVSASIRVHSALEPDPCRVQFVRIRSPTRQEYNVVAVERRPDARAEQAHAAPATSPLMLSRFAQHIVECSRGDSLQVVSRMSRISLSKTTLRLLPGCKCTEAALNEYWYVAIMLKATARSTRELQASYEAGASFKRLKLL